MSGAKDWNVEISPAAYRGLSRLPARVAVAIVEFVTAVLSENPERMSKPLHGELAGVRTARRGDYRVLFTLDYDQRILLVVRIAHRADVYRQR